MASELKPCICGKTPRLDIKKGLAGITKVPFYREQIMCRCGVSSKIFKAPRKAVEAWNTRPTPQETAMQELNHHVGYSRENECWFIRFYPYQTEQQAKDAVSAFRSPTPQETDKAPVEGLVTQWRSPREMLEAFGADNIREGSRAVLGDGIEEDELEDYLEAPIHVLQKILAELVTRSQAEAIIAAERAEKEEARRAEEEAKDCFWSIYETYLEKGGLPVSTEGARSALSNRIASLEADNAAQAARVKELGDERYKLAYAITGGEDAPGYLDSLAVETLVEVARKNTQHWFAETDRADKAETKLAACEKQLSKDRKLRNEAQCDADLWRFSVDMGDHPSLLVKVWKQRKALEAKLAAAEKSGVRHD